MDLISATADPVLFAPWFKDRATWRSWFTFIKALFGQPLDPDERELFVRCTGRTTPPTAPATEAYIVAGRRSGKSFIESLIAVYLATFKDWRPHLAPGEKATVMVIAADKRQARVCMRYIEAMLTEVPMLAALIGNHRTKADDMAFELDGNVVIEVHVASFRSVRGYTVVAALLDELAFWRDEPRRRPAPALLLARCRRQDHVRPRNDTAL
jgi:hypothetical protein